MKPGESGLAVKAAARMNLNTFLLSTAIFAFFTTINLRKELLFQPLLLIQLTLSIPLLLLSTLAYSKLGYREQTERWNLLGWVAFILGYAFILNVIGILVANAISTVLSVIFFVSSCGLALVYSAVDISYRKTVLRERVIKDLLFITVQVCLGLLVALKVL
jgi:hypothetical protein